MQLLGVEALMRWKHPEHGLLSAGSFLPLIADNFLFDDLTAIMLDKSVGQCRKWRRQGLDVQIFRSTSRPFSTDAWTGGPHRGQDHRARRRAREPHHRGAGSCSNPADIPGGAGKLLQLRVRGFGLAIDDFGTAQCSREQLERIPATELKIDRKMLAGAARNAPLTRSAQARVGHGARVESQSGSRGRRNPGRVGVGQ